MITKNYTNVNLMLCNGWIRLREPPKLHLCIFEPYLGNLNVFLLLATMCNSFLLYGIFIYVFFLLFCFPSILAFFFFFFSYLFLLYFCQWPCSYPEISNGSNWVKLWNFESHVSVPHCWWVVLRVWSGLLAKNQHHLGTFYKCRFLAPLVVLLTSVE